jgi:hypothetical protein
MSIFKRIISFCLIIAVLSQTLSIGITLVTFQANRQYYADVLCINKNRPELACHGKCVLMQRLQNEFNKNQDAEHQTLKNLLERELVLIYKPIQPLIIYFTLSDILLNTKPNPYSKKVIAQSAHRDIFHPPIPQV